METVIVKTGILKLADRRTKTINPFNKIEKSSSSVKASSVNTKGGRWVKGATQGQTTKTLFEKRLSAASLDSAFAFCICILKCICILHWNFEVGGKLHLNLKFGLAFEFRFGFAFEFEF